MRFLLLDDEKVSRFTLRQLVQTIPGATISEADHADQARERLAELTAPAVCIFDVRLPGESGLDLLSWLRSEPCYQAFPVLLYTGNDDAETRQRATSLRVAAYVSKPPGADSAQCIAAAAVRLSDELLPHPHALAQRLKTSPARLASYVDALERQLIELGGTVDDAARQALLSKCSQVAKALGSSYLSRALQGLQTGPELKAQWLQAAMLAVGGMRERLAEAV